MITVELILKILKIFIDLEYSGFRSSNYGFAVRIKEILDDEQSTSSGSSKGTKNES